MKDIEALYNQVVLEISKIDRQIAELQGKRNAYTDVRLDLYNILNKCREVKEGDADGK